MPCDTITIELETYTVTVSVSGPYETEAGASIYLDGDKVGETDSNGNLKITDVQSGSHSIRATAGAGNYEDEKTIDVTGDITVSLSLEYVGR